MHLAIITAGGAGMYCGSCMHDNRLARALRQQGIEVSLIPTYTPLTVDEPDQSLNRIFLGGINVYLSGKFPWWSRLPRFLTSWLDSPAIIRKATSGAVSNDATELGDLTISMLQGEQGPHRRAIQELAKAIARDLRPDLIIFSNALLCGALHEIRQASPVPVLCTLQGDDVFLDALKPEDRQQAIELISQRAQEFDGFITQTAFYRDYISAYLSLPVDRFHIVPVGIDLHEHTGCPQRRETGPLRVGYFARFAPEKGLHHLVEGFIRLRNRLPDAELYLGGYQGKQYQTYIRETLETLDRSGISYTNIGSPATLAEKVAFFQRLDLFSVPTEFLEPKGLYVLEAMANGVPVVQPAHGAFPEMLNTVGGGLLVPPRDPEALAEAMAQFADPELRFEHAQRVWDGVRQHYSSDAAARRMVALASSFLTAH